MSIERASAPSSVEPEARDFAPKTEKDLDERGAHVAIGRGGAYRLPPQRALSPGAAPVFRTESAT
jgi:hypothetical protein